MTTATCNVPDVTQGNREIPPGKVLLCDGTLPVGDPRARRVVLDRKLGWGRTEVRLEACFAGWACAGSVARWDNGAYAVAWNDDRAHHGQRYRTFDEALAHFNRIPTKRYGDA